MNCNVAIDASIDDVGVVEEVLHELNIFTNSNPYPYIILFDIINDR